jgi:protoheme IX farnesyltransferase
MEEFAIDLRSSAVAVVGRTRLSFREKVAAYAELTKPRITFLIVLTSAAGFALASRGTLDYLALFRSLLGIALLSSGIATLNQYAERDLDGLMRRTANRPLPSGKLAPWEALAFGAGLTILAELYLLILVNPLTCVLGPDSNRRLPVCLYAAEDAHEFVDVGRRFPGRSAAVNRLDRRARLAKP